MNLEEEATEKDRQHPRDRFLLSRLRRNKPKFCFSFILICFMGQRSPTTASADDLSSSSIRKPSGDPESDTPDPKQIPLPPFSTKRVWKSLTDTSSTSLSIPTDTDWNHFTLSTQNVLADRYTSRSTYNFVPEPAKNLNKYYRTRRLAQHLEFLKSDVVCLQELQADQLEYMLSELRFGEFYESHLKQITRQDVWIPAPKVDESSESAREYQRIMAMQKEGVAILWRKDKFRLIGDPIDVEFNAVAFEEAIRLFGETHGTLESQKRSEFLRLTTLTSHNVATICLLEKKRQEDDDEENPEEEDRRIVVATIHGYFTKSAWMEQSYQYEILLKRVAEVAEQAGASRIVICGDFNMQRTSPTLAFVERGNLDVELDAELEQLEERRLGRSLWFDLADRRPSHPLRVKHTYPDEQKEFSHYSARRRGAPDCLDYIFHSFESLTPVSVYRVDAESVEVPFPSAAEYSDHLLLSANFAFEDGSQEE